MVDHRTIHYLTIHNKRIRSYDTGDEGMWLRWEVVRKGSGDEGMWLRWEVVRKGSGDEGKW